MRGKIGFDQLRVRCIIGCCPEERIEEGEIVVDMRVEVDLTNSVSSDRIGEALDYRLLAKVATDLAQEKKFHLIEAYASSLLIELFRQFPITWGWVKVTKPSALPDSMGAVVELEGEAP